MDTSSTVNDDANISDSTINQPFNIQRPIVDELETTEAPLPPEQLSDSVIEEPPVTYTVFENGSKRGKPLLISFDGFRYNLKKTKKNSVVVLFEYKWKM